MGTQSFGTVQPGDTITLTLAPSCPFQPGTPVNVSVNGVSVGTKVANASGLVTVQITVLSTTQLSVDDPVIVPAICGQNTATATGFSAVANTTVTQTAVFSINCAGGAVGPINNNNTNDNANNNLNNNTNTVTVGGDTINIRVPGGGAPVVVGGPGGGGSSQTQTQSQQQSQFQRIIHDIPAPHHPVHGKIAFTGANIIGLSLLALTLMLIGVVVLSSVKQRRAGRDAETEATEDEEQRLTELTLT